MPSTAQLIDSFGRVVNNLRISVTDRCNFRCHYCMPEEGMTWMKKDELLSFEEIARTVQIMSRLGVNKIRLTGGEPLMRRDLHVLVRLISRIDGIHDIALTTNGFFLKDQAEDLHSAGLKRMTVSMDSLDAATFSEVTRRDYFTTVWEGLDLLQRLDFSPIKVNVVVMRGVNDGEVEKFAELARTKPFIIRFIEYMPIGAGDAWNYSKVVPTREIIQRIERSFPKLVPVEYHGSQPADRFRFEDGVGELGFISSVSEPFCSHCNRIRITSDGKLRTCLFSLKETDLKRLLRSGASDDTISEGIIAAVLKKEEGHLINQPGFVKPERTMSQIGG
ncbi:MAG TPA: GTP 3',8-cyclase MoaA [Bacteroidota bacterium]|nr:GTP 3',8-cyclase MoaA [Bacteroidota bacterium]